MKKLLSLLALLVCTIGAAAQVGWTARPSTGSQDRTVIHADFTVNNGAAAMQGNWTIGVFVGDDCRLVTPDNVPVQTVGQNRFLLLEVPGNFDDENDEGKPITIKVYNTMSEIYTLTSDTELTWKPETSYGWNDGAGPRVKLSLTVPTSYSLEDFTCPAGTQIDLNEHIVVEPAGAQAPENLVWYIGANRDDSFDYSEYATVEGNMLNPIKPRVGYDGVNQPIPYGAYVDGGNFNELKFANIYITQTAKSLEIVTTSFDVYKNDNEELTTFMYNHHNWQAYKTAPEVITEKVEWEYDSEYIEYDGKYSFHPIKGGTTTIKPYIQRGDEKLYPVNDESITINILVPVESISFDWPEGVTFKANVGDNIYQRIADRVTVAPEDVLDKTFTVEAEDEGYFRIDNEKGEIEALKAGTTTLRLVPNGLNGANLSASVEVQIFDPVKEVSFTEDPLSFDLRDEEVNLNAVISGIRNNITGWNQANWTLQQGTITVEGTLTGSGLISANGPSVNLTNDELISGESTVTVTISWNTYDKYDGTTASIEKTNNDGQSFTVKVFSGLQDFDFLVTPDTDDPTHGTIDITPVPADAVFDWDDYTVEFGNYAYEGWEVLNVEGSEGSYTYEALLPGDGYYVEINDWAYGESFTVPEKVTFEPGWQWKSNTWAYISDENTLNDLFGKEISEARTYDCLLYNDPDWGYWGSLVDNPTIDIHQMYKVKMTQEREVYINEGMPSESCDYEVVQGWNWIGSPYFYKRLLSHAFEGTDIVAGTIVQGKLGSAEWDGTQWNGDLTTIDPQQGYYLYLPDESVDGQLTLAMEVYGGMEQGDDVASARAARRSVWSYDHSRFASNMSVVAELSDLANAEQFTIGAFVGDECRGEGIIENGRAFITVHTDGGELVTFRLHNELTGEYFDIDQTIRSGAIRVGSLKEPFQLTSNAVVTGIGSVQSSELGVQSYDLGGRTVKANAKGMTIQRQSDGSVRKVVK